jgi:hypothetical protein
MTDREALTLNQLFSTETGLSDKQMTEAESCDSMVELKKRLTQEAKTVWPIARGIILKKLVEMLNIRVPDIMVAAWNKYEAIAKYTDGKQYPPSETYMVPLAEHTIESVHKPSLEICLNNQPVGEIKFEITLFIKVEGIILEIKGGRIMKVHTGSCKGGGSLKCEGQLLLKKETSPFELPGTIDLGEGVPIPKLGGDY